MLLSSLLAVSARFFRNDLYDPLLDHAETLLGRQIVSGSLDLAAIQAIMVLVLWKSPEDRSAYLKIGIAVRAAQQLGINKAQEEVKGSNQQARMIVDKTRTWYSEC